jgi:phospholipase C
MTALDQVRTIVILIFENRSFDHMLGYRSLPPLNAAVDGQQRDPAWLARYTNTDHGTSWTPFLSTNPYSLPAGFDPPHERPNVAAQLGPATGTAYPMNQFVSAIPASVSADPPKRGLVMGYFGPTQVPMTDFLAKNFAICDRWFCSLPAGTQPNRLMAMSGTSRIEMNQTPIPAHDLVYDWLTARNVRWRVYHQGIPFFALMPKWIPEILGNNRFRDFSALGSDLINTPPSKQPQVIFVEPTYTDAPHVGRSTDDHAPSGVSDGQEFLMQVYNAVTLSRKFWQGTLFVVYYDEHGGFFDHVSPPAIPTTPPTEGLYPPFPSLGVRVPAYIVSPFVRPGAICHELLDHTSVLKLLGTKFGGGSYSPGVDGRQVVNLADVLDDVRPITQPPAAPALRGYIASRLPDQQVTPPSRATPQQEAFGQALDNLRSQGADATHPKFGRLIERLDNPHTHGPITTT